MDSLSLRRHLRAVLGLHDAELRANNFNPDALRANFYKVYTVFKETVDEKHEVHCQISPTDFDDYIVIKTDSWSESPEEPSLDEHDQWEDKYRRYLVIGKKSIVCSTFSVGCDFITREMVWAKPPKHQPIYMGDWTKDPVKPANFVDIANRYGLLILDICEKWGFDKIVDWIKTH